MNYRETSIQIMYFVFVSLKIRLVFVFRICISQDSSCICISYLYLSRIHETITFITILKVLTPLNKTTSSDSNFQPLLSKKSYLDIFLLISGVDVRDHHLFLNGPV